MGRASLVLILKAAWWLSLSGISLNDSFIQTFIKFWVSSLSLLSLKIYLTEKGRDILLLRILCLIPNLTVNVFIFFLYV